MSEMAAYIVDAGTNAAPPDVIRTGADLLRGALLDSRQRWRDLVSMATDFAFETDAAGRLMFVAPATVLGWSTSALLGQPALMLLAGPQDSFNPFTPSPAYRDRRAWVRRAEGGTACFSFAAAPLMEHGVAVGMRGVARDVTTEHARESNVAGALRRGEVVEHILWQMRQEVLAPRMMDAVLDGLTAALGASGAAVVDLLATTEGEVLLHHTGADAPELIAAAIAVLQVETLDPLMTSTMGHPVIACPSYTRFGQRAGLCVWRIAGGTPWTEEEGQLVSAVTTIVRVVLEHDAIQRELARQARTDPLTGLLNRRSFLEEVNRRIDRLDREEMPGTLMFVDLDNFKRVNDECGHDVGDQALVHTAQLLRRTVRPADLVARLGGDEFALWLDGSDELTAAERAERLRLDGPAAMAAVLPPDAPPVSTSIGIASRHPRAGENLDEVMRRADAAMYDVKRAGRGHWRVARDPLHP
ncbi:sensor domain-containing diguanylate cyclase [Acidisphaera sp. L21]|uniref:sensor domain-containing diguanylate cyclase n=1 Tax=Acidisphaera sp. L21 TaxID=1641851 RepID=UPI00131D62BE|nr:sensor domain-containing diguanylate cyclase [Acidisphaera sp. L21]